MFDIKFKLNGRSVSPNQLGKALQSELTAQIQRNVQSAARQCRCPIHGKTPTIRPRSTSGGKMHFDIEGCCDAAVARVRRQLR